MSKAEEEIRAELFALRDEKYKSFHSKLIPTVNPNTVIGVRTPQLRAYAKRLFGQERAREFLLCLPHAYYDENNLHAFLVEQIPGFAAALAETERFLPYIDNWATCDMFLPKAFRQSPAALLPKIREWTASGETYTVRYAIGLLLSLFSGGLFRPEHLSLAASAACGEYYVNMMIAWYFATELAFHPDDVLPWLTDGRLPLWINNKTIQKAVESRRIPPETKAALKLLRRSE